MFVLGIDLGIRPENPSAAALADLSATPRLVAAWTLAPARRTWQARVQALHGAIYALITREAPALVAYEAPHGEKNLQTYRKLAALEGAILAACGRAGVAVVDVQPAQAKQALAGDHQADKAAMVDAARMYFGAALFSHEADALGVALAGEVKIRQGRLLCAAGGR